MGYIEVDMMNVGGTPTPSIERVGDAPTADLYLVGDSLITTIHKVGKPIIPSLTHLGGVVVKGSVTPTIGRDSLVISEAILSFDNSEVGTSKVVYVNASRMWSAELIDPDGLFSISTIGGLGGATREVVITLVNANEQTSIYTASVVFKCGGMRKILQLTSEAAALEYTPLTHIESSGTQWIDTGYTINTNTDIVEFVFQNVGSTIYKWIMGEHDNNARFGLGTGDGVAKRNVAYGATTYKVSDAQIYNSAHTLIANDKGVYIDGTKVANFSSFVSSSSIYLFNLNLNNTNYCGEAKVWSYKHYRNGNLILDLIPVLDKDNIVCMYDKVSENYLYNQGSGEFIAGDKI